MANYERIAVELELLEEITNSLEILSGSVHNEYCSVPYDICQDCSDYRRLWQRLEEQLRKREREMADTEQKYAVIVRGFANQEIVKAFEDFLRKAITKDAGLTVSVVQAIPGDKFVAEMSEQTHLQILLDIHDTCGLTTTEQLAKSLKRTHPGIIVAANVRQVAGSSQDATNG